MLRRRYVDFPITDVLQMMGRAGRPQYDKHGVAVIMVAEPKKSFYKKCDPRDTVLCRESYALCKGTNVTRARGLPWSEGDCSGQCVQIPVRAVPCGVQPCRPGELQCSSCFGTQCCALYPPVCCRDHGLHPVKPHLSRNATPASKIAPVGHRESMEFGAGAQLPEHFNAEVVAGTIGSRADAVDYLTWTFLFRRLLCNPSYYDLEATDPDDVNAFLSDLVEDTLLALEVTSLTLLPRPALM